VDEIIYNFVNAIFLSLVGMFSRHRVEAQQKEILRNRLLKDGLKWRTFGSLCRSIRANEYTTRELLLKIGARANTGDRDVWTLQGK
jgi:hypothetical protein